MKTARETAKPKRDLYSPQQTPATWPTDCYYNDENFAYCQLWGATAITAGFIGAATAAFSIFNSG
jgi:hypothetical protein